MPHTESGQGNWTRTQVLAALHVYLLLPFGQLHKGNPTIKQLAGWMDRTPSAVALKLVNLASLDPVVRSRGLSGMSKTSAMDRKVWGDLMHQWDATELEALAAYLSVAKARGETPSEDMVVESLDALEPGINRSATVQVRVNQARFRKMVLAGYESTCCISHLSHEKLVIASHIVPWSEDSMNRLNPQNGLCLSALHDRAYDQGLITVLPDFTVKVSDQLRVSSSDEFLNDSLLRFDGTTIRMPSKFAPEPRFLERHARRFGFL